MCIPVFGQTKYFKIEKIISQEKQNQFLKKLDRIFDLYKITITKICNYINNQVIYSSGNIAEKGK